GKVWFTAEGAKAVARFDPATSSIDWIMGTGQDRTHMLYVTPDEKQVDTANVSAGTVSVIEKVTGAGPPARTDWTQTVIAVGKGDEGFDVSPDGREVWTANAQDGSISVLNLGSRTVSATLDAKFVASNRLKFTPDGTLALVTSLREGDLLVYDVSARKEKKRVHIGRGAAGILMDPSGTRAFVACT